MFCIIHSYIDACGRVCAFGMVLMVVRWYFTWFKDHVSFMQFIELTIIPRSPRPALRLLRLSRFSFPILHCKQISRQFDTWNFLSPTSHLNDKNVNGSEFDYDPGHVSPGVFVYSSTCIVYHRTLQSLSFDGPTVAYSIRRNRPPQLRPQKWTVYRFTLSSCCVIFPWLIMHYEDEPAFSFLTLKFFVSRCFTVQSTTGDRILWF